MQRYDFYINYKKFNNNIVMFNSKNRCKWLFGRLVIPAYFFVFNVSSANSEQCKLCVNGPLYIDARLLWKQAIGSNCP